MGECVSINVFLTNDVEAADGGGASPQVTTLQEGADWKEADWGAGKNLSPDLDGVKFSIHEDLCTVLYCKL